MPLRRLPLLRAAAMLVVVTVVAGFGYPLVATGLSVLVFPRQAEGSLLYRHGRLVGSSLIGQSFSAADGAPLRRYFQPRPSDAGSGYDPSASGASNLGPDNPLLVGFVAGVNTVRADGSVAPANPFATRQDPRCVPMARNGTPVTVVDPPAREHLARAGDAYACDPDTVPERAIAYRRFNDLPATAPVPVDAVTASGSGLDPDISVANALDQATRVARARHEPVARVDALVHRFTEGRQFGFMGEPAVDVVTLNLALDGGR